MSLTTTTSLLSTLRQWMRYGETFCHACDEEIECMELEDHLFEMHEDLLNKCFFCGVFDIVRDEHKDPAEESVRHMMECFRMFTSTGAADNCDGALLRRYRGELVLDEDVVYQLRRERDDQLMGSSGQNMLAENVNVSADVLRFWNYFNFGVPMWMREMVADERNLLNEFEYHPNANIDTVWAKVFGHPLLEFHHVRVHLCVWDEFVKELSTMWQVCSPLRYMCMCDKYGQQHVHLILVCVRHANVKSALDKVVGKAPCRITKTRELYMRGMKMSNMKVVPGWPEHEHISCKTIYTDTQLFNTIAYICNRKSMPTSKKVVESEEISVKIMKSTVHSESYLKKTAAEIENFIKSYRRRFEYSGSHYYIFRTIYPHAPLWFAAVSQRGLSAQIEWMLKTELPICSQLRQGKNLLRMPYRDVCEYMIKLMGPLRAGQLIHHTYCADGRQGSIKDNTRYMYLGRGEYMFMASQTERCCPDNLESIRHSLNRFRRPPHERLLEAIAVAERKKKATTTDNDDDDIDNSMTCDENETESDDYEPNY